MSDPRRRCSQCHAYLSVYNQDDKCYPCQDHQRAYGATSAPTTSTGVRTAGGRPYAAWSNRKTPEQIEQEQAVLMTAIREHTTGPFKMQALKAWLPWEKGRITQLLLRAERQGLIEQIGRESTRASHGGVLVWDMVGRSKREVA